uniref:Mitochondrial carnitine/acylcarnitine carrier protein n=2 Tax=Caligus rogercresseyi TaxID=217165 RepID=C1BPW3_CALRO|nr:Mitochondrial carnitine/acylcarnitine carrier protein [Caligus rogercresseyi]
MTEKQRTSFVKNFVAGGFGGICAIASGHPFDTIKVRLQTMPLPKKGEPALYNGAMDCLSKTIRQEGFKGLYKGMGAPIVGSVPLFALSFMGFSLGKRILMRDPGEELGLPQLFVAGGISGAITTVVTAPGERIKCLLQVQQTQLNSHGTPKYNGPIHVLQSLLRDGGIRSIYRGTSATLLRDVPGSGAYFASYEVIQRFLAPNGDRSQISVSRTVFAGGMAGLFHWGIAISPDVLKSRLQTAPEGKYSGLTDVFRTLMREEGPRAFFKGVGPVMTRAFPANACCFMGYELALYFFNRVAPDL